MTESGRDEPFVREVRRQAERIQAARRLGFWRGLGLAGMVGWMVSLPAVLGALVGRWLDRLSGSGLVWTLALLGLGLLAGCAAAWRHVRQELHE
jgi:ATP synthase protein I